MPSPLDDLAATVRDLVEPYTHREPLDLKAINHRRGLAQLALRRAKVEQRAARKRKADKDTRAQADRAVAAAQAEFSKARQVRYSASHASLLQQLEDAVQPGSGDGGPMSSTPCESAPPWNEQAIDVLLRIDVAVARWLSGYCQQRLRATTADNLRALVGAATMLDVEQQRTLARDARAWRTWARVEADWEREIVAVDQRAGAVWDGCPCCERRGTLRVKNESAWCVDCGAAWDDDSLFLDDAVVLGEKLTALRQLAELALVGCAAIGAPLVCPTCGEAVGEAHPRVLCSPWRASPEVDAAEPLAVSA